MTPQEAKELGYFGTATGGAAYVRAPFESDIRVSDIAIALSRISRFGGHSIVPYSVAQHSVLVSYLCDPQHALLGLLHDATEAYLGDVISPLKRILGRTYADLERSWALAIGVRFGAGSQLAYLPEDVKRADETALELERHSLLNRGKGWTWWGKPEKPTLWGKEATILPWGTRKAEQLFLDRFAQLTGRGSRLFTKPRDLTASRDSDITGSWPVVGSTGKGRAA